VLPGLIELFLQRLCPVHSIAIPLEHIGFLSGSLHDILHKAIIITRVLKYGGIRLLKGPVTYLHPLLSPAHRLQIAGYRRRVDKVICQKFEPIATSRCGLRHRRRTYRLRVLDFRRADDYVQARPQQCIVTHLFCHPGAAVSASSVMASVITSASGTTPSTGTASGITLPSTCAPVDTRHTISVPGGYDYYLR
jgi:hypothetical protein